MDQTQQNTDSNWVCMGSCQAVISDDEYDKGLKACGAEGCTLHAQPFVRGKKDPVSGKNIADDAPDMPAGTS